MRRFNSLQTGNCIQTQFVCEHSLTGIILYLVSIPFKRETAFKLDPAQLHNVTVHFVSIPFKRETAFKRKL